MTDSQQTSDYSAEIDAIDELCAEIPTEYLVEVRDRITQRLEDRCAALIRDRRKSRGSRK